MEMHFLSNVQYNIKYRAHNLCLWLSFFTFMEMVRIKRYECKTLD